MGSSLSHRQQVSRPSGLYVPQFGQSMSHSLSEPREMLPLSPTRAKPCEIIASQLDSSNRLRGGVSPFQEAQLASGCPTGTGHYDQAPLSEQVETGAERTGDRQAQRAKKRSFDPRPKALHTWLQRLSTVSAVSVNSNQSVTEVRPFGQTIMSPAPARRLGVLQREVQRGSRRCPR